MTDATGYYRGRWMEAKYPGYCAACGASIWRGATIWYVPRLRRVECSPCGKRTAEAVTHTQRPASAG